MRSPDANLWAPEPGQLALCKLQPLHDSGSFVTQAFHLFLQLAAGVFVGTVQVRLALATLGPLRLDERLKSLREMLTEP